jgi:outer membrane lipoprotein SlyB
MGKLAVVLATGLAGGWLLCPGCNTAVRGPEGRIEGTIRSGTLTATLDRGIGRSFGAVQEAVQQLGFTTVMTEQDGVAAEVLARDAQQQNITIKLEALSPSRTSLTMRVGIFGDKNKSNVIFRQIQENLRAR